MPVPPVGMARFNVTFHMVSASSPAWRVGIVQCQCYGLSYAKIGILVDNLLLLVNVFSKVPEFLSHSTFG